MCLWEIDERTLGDQQRLELDEHVASRSWDKAVPNSRDVNQILSPVISDNDGVHSLCAPECILRSQVLVHCSTDTWPRTRCACQSRIGCPSSWQQHLQPLGANCVEHVSGRCFEIIRNPDSGRLKLENRFHHLMAFDKRQAREIAIAVNEKVENEVMDA